MKDKLVWVGVVVIALGLVLPWATFSASLGGSRVGGGTISGYEYLQSIIALGVSVIGIFVGMQLSKQAKAISYIASGLIVAVVAGSALVDLSGPAQKIQRPTAQLRLPHNTPREIRDAQQRARPPNTTARVSSDPHIGVFVVILGGLLIAAGGFLGMAGKPENAPG